MRYTNLLDKHIDEEDLGLYLFAQKNLKADTIEKMNREVQRLEHEAADRGLQNQYFNVLAELEAKYLD